MVRVSLRHGASLRGAAAALAPRRSAPRVPLRGPRDATFNRRRVAPRRPDLLRRPRVGGARRGGGRGVGGGGGGGGARVCGVAPRRRRRRGDAARGRLHRRDQEGRVSARVRATKPRSGVFWSTFCFFIRSFGHFHSFFKPFIFLHHSTPALLFVVDVGPASMLHDTQVAANSKSPAPTGSSPTAPAAEHAEAVENAPAVDALKWPASSGAGDGVKPTSATKTYSHAFWAAHWASVAAAAAAVVGAAPEGDATEAASPRVRSTLCGGGSASQPPQRRRSFT